MMWWGNNSTNLGWGFFGWTFVILWWLLMIAAIVAIVKWLLNQFRPSAAEKSPLDILKERYARGEITKGEFEERKKDLA